MKNLKTTIKILLSLGLGIGLITWFWSAMSEQDKTETISAFKRANYFWVIMAPLIGFAGNFFRTQRWRLMLKPLGYEPSFVNTFFSVMIMYFFNLFVPRLGEVTRCTILAQYEHVPVEKSLGTMVTERLIDVICLGIVFLLIIVFLGKENYDSLTANFNQLTAGFGGGTLMTILKFSIPVLLIAGMTVFSLLYIRKHGVDKLKELILSKIKSLFTSILSVKDVKEKPQFILLTVGMWLSYLVMFYVNYLALPETSNLPLISALVCLLFGSFAVIITPGGIGIFPIVIQMVLVSFA
ncbi:MAG TPA: lysylphosphatidylglycerol synthase transmembrane domain-containing protein, partial [Chitinophagales bacterium]|nr:lysylphosphatidylglycerol synthase transmembrane domain-containing protein [Chitinophagales bacterium]